MSAHLPCGGLPFSFSILRTVSRNSRSSLAVEPTTWLAMIEDEAWPSAQAFTSWAKSVTTGPSILRSILTVEPHSLECAVAQSSKPGYVAGQFDDPLVVNVVQHRVRSRACRPDRPWRPRSRVLYMVGDG